MNEVPTADGGPGFLAFLAFFLLAIALWFLMRNMNARMRRMSYRQQAAHRGAADPQATPEDLAAESDGTLSGAPEATPAPTQEPPGTGEEPGEPPAAPSKD
jgi:flagellar biosynthesis/type III secretory pathway M-ring protein FliF/YscJ